MRYTKIQSILLIWKWIKDRKGERQLIVSGGIDTGAHVHFLAQGVLEPSVE